MKTLIISENSPFTSFLQDFIYLLKPDEKVEIADSHNGLMQCYFSSPDIVLYDYDFLDSRANRLIQNMYSVSPSVRMIIGFTERFGKDMNEHISNSITSFFYKDDAVNQLGLIYGEQRLSYS